MDSNTNQPPSLGGDQRCGLRVRRRCRARAAALLPREHRRRGGARSRLRGERHTPAHFSSDLVFDGAQTAPYVEHDAVAPLQVYGQSKAAAGRLVLDHNAGALVVRTSAFFGPWDEHNVVTTGAARAGA
jgi:hypothetical protein